MKTIVIIFAFIGILGILYLGREYNDEHICSLISSRQDALMFFKKRKWLGFSSKMNATQVLDRCVRIGLISKLERNQIIREHTIDGSFCCTLFSISCHYFHDLETILFRFDILKKTLIEIDLVYSKFNQQIIEISDSPEVVYEKRLAELEKKYGPSEKWTDIGVGLRADDKTQIMLFLTSEKSKT